MEIIAIISIVVLIYVVSKLNSKNKTTQPKEIFEETNTKRDENKYNISINVTTNTDLSDESSESTPIKKAGEREWILNPNSTFELTIQNVDEDTAQVVKEIFDDKEIYWRQKEEKLLPIFATKNLKVKEIENYKLKYKRVYTKKIDELIEKTDDWNKLGARDKEDLLFDFRNQAIEHIYENPACDLEILFEYEPVDLTFDDELIKVYGFENLQTYFTYADKLEKVRVVSNDYYHRKNFENLVELGLATRGKEIPLDNILSTLTLKELNQIANNPDKKYYRKKQAIEYILTLNDLDSILGEYISFREIFKLNPLPDKYTHIDIDSISTSWAYHEQECKLLVDTYRNSLYSKNFDRDSDYIKGYKINYTYQNPVCPCAKDMSEIEYTASNLPKLPYHIGCNCYADPIYNFDD